MKIKILSSSRAQLSEITPVTQRPAFRKATRNMSLATVALEKALNPLRIVFEKDPSRFGLILVSASGELETTIEFLKTYHEAKLARPLLFQNSLHNATAGFLSIQFGLTGPVLTVCGSGPSETEAFESAEALLQSQQCDYCIVLSVEIWPRFKNFETFPSEEVDGAACFILSHSENQNVKPLALAELHDPSGLKKSSKQLWEPDRLDDNLFYQLAMAIESRKCPSERFSLEWQGSL